MDKREISSKRTPIYRESGFLFENIEKAAQAFKLEHNKLQSANRFIYTRYVNPTVVATEKLAAKLEGCEWAILTASSIAAIDIALAIFQEKQDTGTWLFFSELYGGTNAYIDEVLRNRRGINVERLMPENGKERFNLYTLAEKLDRLKPKLLFFEPISNPLLITVDGHRVIQMANERGIKTIVDNTFVTSHLWRPLESGADIVVHSATKYLGGHGNITAGVVAGNDAQLREENYPFPGMIRLSVGFEPYELLERIILKALHTIS